MSTNITKKPAAAVGVASVEQAKELLRIAAGQKGH
jgi:hypothetical protein